MPPAGAQFEKVGLGSDCRRDWLCAALYPAGLWPPRSGGLLDYALKGLLAEEAVVIVAFLLLQSLSVRSLLWEGWSQRPSLELRSVAGTALIIGDVSSFHIGPQIAQTKRKAWHSEGFHFTANIKGFGK